jgi:hypothetical protein
LLELRGQLSDPEAPRAQDSADDADDRGAEEREMAVAHAGDAIGATADRLEQALALVRREVWDPFDAAPNLLDDARVVVGQAAPLHGWRQAGQKGEGGRAVEFRELACIDRELRRELEGAQFGVDGFEAREAPGAGQAQDVAGRIGGALDVRARTEITRGVVHVVAAGERRSRVSRAIVAIAVVVVHPPAPEMTTAARGGG